jgi:hypothetical protein
MGAIYVDKEWPNYTSGALQGGCPSSHLYEACVTELAFAAAGILAFVRVAFCRKCCGGSEDDVDCCCFGEVSRVNTFAMASMLVWLWTVVEVGIARAHCSSVGETDLWTWAIVTVVGWVVAPRCLFWYAIRNIGS